MLSPVKQKSGVKALLATDLQAAHAMS